MSTPLSSTARAVLVTGGAQATMQLLAFAAGVVVIRLLPVQEYAFYTIVNTALGAMTVMSDGGIGNSVLAQGGKVWHDSARLGKVISAGLALRRQFAGIVALFGVPLTALLLGHQGATWWQAGCMAIAILPLFFLSATAQLLEAVPRLHQNLMPLQRVQIGAHLGRLALIFVALPSFPSTLVATLIAAVPQGWANWRLRHLAARQADWQTAGDNEVRGLLVSQVKRTLPGAVYYAMSGQLTVWLIALFGEGTAVASVGALSRLAMALTVLSGIFAAIVVPRFARIPAADSRRIRRRYWQAQLVLMAVCVVPVAALAVMPGKVLSILGPSYAGLEIEALLMALASVVGILGGSAFVLGAARGIVAPPQVAIPLSLLVQVVLVLGLPLGTITGVIWLGLLSSAFQWGLHVAYFFRQHDSSLI